MTTTMSAARARWVLPASAATGILFMLVAQLLVMPANDAVVKYLVASVPIGQLAWARFFFNFLLLAPVALWHHRGHALAPSRPGLQLLRGVLIVASNLLFIAGLRFVPLADATATVFVAPLAVATFSPWLLGERVGPIGNSSLTQAIAVSNSHSHSMCVEIVRRQMQL